MKKEKREELDEILNDFEITESGIQLMTGLDKKLREIVDRISADFYYEGGEYSEEQYQDRVNSIKQAFTDEGYVQFKKTQDLIKGMGLMTGQEFYDRFWKELKKADKDIEPEDWADAYYVSFFLEAAKRAAGLEEK